ncbi:TetR family transcriptional regulator [Longimycelium tulufanense]|uniref:TetR family transcriptional regulator n=1 Tax=Longimycelium tulufanense TaxID=907463 RepID=A0A8J3FS54_9PSEU|nr:TetR/AcrR family transcriptional regulator C-terminal domain-containing protein [Longimycelium tulufanense]GGM33235.1 TetR family transcriptional regulator [Longimycelium tulufanense]
MKTAIRGARPRSAAGLPALSPDQVVDAAIRLTEEHGLDGWTIRQLAAAIRAWPAVVYHHVGDREAVVDAVLQSVVAGMPVPADDLPWRDWWHRFLVDGRATLRRYRGVARRLATRGPTVPAMLAIADHGIRVLRRAGFGAESSDVYQVLVSSSFLMVALEDEWAADPSLRSRTAAVLAAHRDREDMPGLAALASLWHRTCNDQETLRARDEWFFGYAVDRALDAVQVRLDILTAK